MSKINIEPPIELQGTVKGMQVLKGDKGDQGIQGIPGEKGDKGEPGTSACVITPVQYAELVNLRNNSELLPGAMYRITDFDTTSSDPNTQCANHHFDIIIRAIDVNRLDYNAYAAYSARDTDGYFANCNLGKWELKYDLNNDTSKYAWADTANGKGVIFFMKDEYNNQLPYDFKNIMFKRWKIDTADELQHMSGKYFAANRVMLEYGIVCTEYKYLYTFTNNIELQQGNVADLSQEGAVYDNVFLKNSVTLPNCVFISDMAEPLHSNTFKGSICTATIHSASISNNIVFDLADSMLFTASSFKSNFLHCFKESLLVVNGEFAHNTIKGDFCANTIITSLFSSNSFTGSFSANRIGNNVVLNNQFHNLLSAAEISIDLRNNIFYTNSRLPMLFNLQIFAERTCCKICEIGEQQHLVAWHNEHGQQYVLIN